MNKSILTSTRLFLSLWFAAILAFVILKAAGILHCSWWILLWPLLGFPAAVSLSLSLAALCLIILNNRLKRRMP